jgi:hypothetical protein
MRLTIISALCGIAAVALTVSGLPADAAAKKRAPVLSQGAGAVSSQARVRRVQRARTRITVRPRSYLDGGTEVLPGDRKFTDYAIPPTHSASSVIENTAFYHRSPLPGPFDLPGRNNPMQW